MPGPATIRRPRGRSRYVPPPDTFVLDSGLIGITNGLRQKFPQLYAAGDRTLLETPAIAIVGSRKVSPEGYKRAGQLARDVVRAGLVVMSGLALGVDEAAHEAAIANGGRTIAIIGTPLDKAYPAEHADLQAEIYSNHLLLSPFAVGSSTFPSAFPERNRVMAHLSRATVIVEASDISGVLHQALEALSVGRPLLIAQSVLDGRKLTWPVRFIGKPGVHVFGSSAEVIAKAIA